MGLRCPNVQCQGSGSDKAGSIIRYGFYKTKRGRQRRYRCRICGKTFCSNSGKPRGSCAPRNHEPRISTDSHGSCFHRSVNIRGSLF